MVTAPATTKTETITLADAATMLGLARTTVYRMIERGELTATRHPLHNKHGHLQIPRAQVERLLKRSGAPATPPEGAISITDAAKILGVSRSFAYTMIRRGELVPMRNSIYRQQGPTWLREADVRALAAKPPVAVS
jgi:excisionase family DNA binding protein